jgi:molybdopterin molybdotransferase
MKDFLRLVSLEELYNFLRDFSPIRQCEDVEIEDCTFRVSTKDLNSPEDLPSYKRSSVDGYAVRYEDVVGASYSSPVILKNKGAIEMGKSPSFSIFTGETCYIPTGGALPDGANAVVMIENTENTDDIIEIYKQVTYEENTIIEGEDFKKNQILIQKGQRILSKDIGSLAALGINKINVYALPKVKIFSTGNEIVEKKDNKYQIRDSNSYAITSLLKKFSNVRRMGILKDNFNEIYKNIKKIYDETDVIVLSGGSSMGVRDYTLETFAKFGKPIYQIHGVRIKPGKPTIVYITKDKIFIGLPGHPVSSFISGIFVLLPIIKKYGGDKNFIQKPHKYVESKIRIPSQEGRKDYYRVKLDGEKFEPIFSKSSSLSSLLYGEGLIEIDENSEGVYEGEKIPYYSLEDL